MIPRKLLFPYGVSLPVPLPEAKRLGRKIGVKFTDLKKRTGSSLYRLESEAKESWRQPSCWDHRDILSYMIPLRRKTFRCYLRTCHPLNSEESTFLPMAYSKRKWSQQDVAAGLNFAGVRTIGCSIQFFFLDQWVKLR